MTLDDALKMPNSAFSPCAPLVERFDAIGKETGLPPLLLASVSMQESKLATFSSEEGVG